MIITITPGWQTDVLLMATVLCLLSACGQRRRPEFFQVRAGQPYYILRSPDRTEAPFHETASAYGDQAGGWVSLGERMVLKIEIAFFKEAGPKRDIANFLGTEIQSFKALPNGQLRPMDLQTLASRPQNQPSVATLLPPRRQRLRAHRFFFQVAMHPTTGKASAVLLSAGSADEIERLSAMMIQNPGSVCGTNMPNCTVFPDGGSASLGMEVVVNRKPLTLPWGSSLASVVGQRVAFTIHRSHRGRFFPIVMDLGDREALRLPLLPGDSIAW